MTLFFVKKASVCLVILNYIWLLHGINAECNCNLYIKRVKPCAADISNARTKYVAHYMTWFTGGKNEHWCSTTYGASFYTPQKLGDDDHYYHRRSFSRSKSWIYYDQNECATVCAHLNEMHGSCLHGLWLNYHSFANDQVVENVIGAIESTFTDMYFAIDPDTSEVNNMLVDRNYLANFRRWAQHRNHYKVGGKPLIPCWSSSVNGGVQVDSSFARDHYLLYTDIRTAGGWRPRDCDENDRCTKFHGYFLWIGSISNGNGGMIDGYTGHRGRNVRGVCDLEVKVGLANRGFRNAHKVHKHSDSYVQCACGPAEPKWCDARRCNGESDYLLASLKAAENAPCELDFVQVATWNDWTEGTAIEAGYEKPLNQANDALGFCRWPTSWGGAENDGSFDQAITYRQWLSGNPKEALFLDCTRGTVNGVSAECRNKAPGHPRHDLNVLKRFIENRF